MMNDIHIETPHLNGESAYKKSLKDEIQVEMEPPQDEEEDTPQLEFLDEVHHSSMLKSLNMMRKNRHFCDVILHVCAWLYNQTDFTKHFLDGHWDSRIFHVHIQGLLADG